MEPAAADTTQLKKALEWELSLDSRDLRSHAWYHGAISRMRAEEIVERDGDFLVRDCTSQPGNYVLTCNCKMQGLHFVINKVVLQPDTVYERVQYQFEDDAYDTVPDLITYYVASGKCITFASGARISSPQNRLYPLSFYVTKYGLQQHDPSMVSPLASPMATSSSTLRFSPYNSYRSPGQSPPRTKREIPPRLPFKKQRSHSITPAELHSRSFTLQHRPSSADCSNSADGVVQSKLLMTRSFCHDLPHSTHSLPRPSLQYRPEDAHKIHGGMKTHGHCEPAHSSTLERKRFVVSEESKDIDDQSIPDQPPPKPSRIPSLIGVDLKDANQGNHKRESICFGNGVPIPEGLCNIPQGQCRIQRDSDSGNGSGDSVLSTLTGDNPELITTIPSHCGVVIKNPRHSQVIVPSREHAIPNSCSTATLSGIEYDSTEAEEELLCSFPTLPHMDTVFDLDSFTTLLLPTSDNKPLDETAMQGVKMMLQESGSRIIANHLTRVDLELTVGERLACLEGDGALGVSCGLELCALPHGHQLRMDLIERTECLKLLVAVTILTCASDDDRADMLNKWIQVAVDTKSALGNLFGFCGLMMGLCMPQVTRLSATWHVLRQRYTDSAFNYEAKLRPMMKSMHDCTNPQAPNTTIPHLLPFILLQELTYDHLIGCKSSDISATVHNCLGSWDTASDFGLSSLFAHMEHARKYTGSLPTFRRNAENVAGDLKGDVLLTDAFRTEFHLKFLWGSRGAGVAMEERHSKFEQVLKAMSERCEPSTSAAGSEKQH